MIRIPVCIGSGAAGGVGSLGGAKWCEFLPLAPIIAAPTVAPALLAQTPAHSFPFRVRDFAMLGRSPRRG